MMDPTPTIINDVKSDIIECNDDQKELRLKTCNSCDKFNIENNVTKCIECGCTISLMITYTFKECPLQKW